ncbi:putative leukotriene A-4 hydrolase (LTA-4 hydrolase) (Leukotriene A(4) hydrolase), partial [Modicella reniformis]
EFFSPSDIADFSSAQTVVFLEMMNELKPLPHEHLDQMDQVYQLTVVRNSEIRLRWHLLCLKASYEKIYPEVTAFASSTGRMKMARPLLRCLCKAKNGDELAKETFLAHRSFYHPIAATMIAKDLGLAK